MLIPRKGEIRKPTKTISGITPVAVMLPPRKCEHGNCIYCPSLDVPQSYTPKSPAVMRAMNLKYSAFEQVKARIKSFEVMNHPTEKIELIIMGGTFLEYPKKFQYEFVKACFDGMNGKKSKSLQDAQKKNEKAKHRCVALCIETRPDVCSDEDIKRMREFGCTRVELGVQIIDDKIYKKVKRGHKVKDVALATKRLKDAGFKVGYHIMPGLPGSNVKKDLELFKKLFKDEKFKPDQLKLYPCQVMPGSELEKLYWKKKYKPYSKEEIKKVLIEMLKTVPRYCRVMRIMREIPPEYIVAGTINIDLRKDIEKELREKKAKLKEIRYREVGFNIGSLKSSRPPARRKVINRKTRLKVDDNLILKTTKYKASSGDEYFLEIVNSEDVLFGLLRLRVYESSHPPTRRNVVNQKTSLKTGLVNSLDKSQTQRVKCAIIREIHIYGKALELGMKSKIASQHKGFGKWLMNEAEEIVKKNKVEKLSVISGIGVRDYYRKLGYKLEGSYMVKIL